MPLFAATFATPTTKTLIKVEGGGAITQFNVGKPFGRDVQEASVETNRSPDEREHNPAVGGIIRFPGLTPPSYSAFSLKEASLFLASSSSSQLFSRGILDPVYGGEIFVSFYLIDFLMYGFFSARDCFILAAFGGRDC